MPRTIKHAGTCTFHFVLAAGRPPGTYTFRRVRHVSVLALLVAAALAAPVLALSCPHLGAVPCLS